MDDYLWVQALFNHEELERLWGQEPTDPHQRFLWRIIRLGVIDPEAGEKAMDVSVRIYFLISSTTHSFSFSFPCTNIPWPEHVIKLLIMPSSNYAYPYHEGYVVLVYCQNTPKGLWTTSCNSWTWIKPHKGDKDLPKALCCWRMWGFIPNILDYTLFFTHSFFCFLFPVSPPPDLNTSLNCSLCQPLTMPTLTKKDTWYWSIVNIPLKVHGQPAVIHELGSSLTKVIKTCPRPSVAGGRQ